MWLPLANYRCKLILGWIHCFESDCGREGERREGGGGRERGGGRQGGRGKEGGK